MSLTKNIKGVEHQLEFVTVLSGPWGINNMEIYRCVDPDRNLAGYVGIVRPLDGPVLYDQMGPLCPVVRFAAIRASVCHKYRNRNGR